MKRLFTQQFCKIFTLTCLSLFIAPSLDAQHLMIVSANDTHSNIDPGKDGQGGIARRRAIYDKLRAENPNTVVVHAGDAVQGSLYFLLYEGEVEYSMIDSLGYDVIIMGNHELDNGMEELAHYYRNVKANKLSANYDVTDTPLEGLFQPYWIKGVGDKRVAFFGINANPAGLISSANSNGIRYLDPRDVADATAKYLKEVQHADYAVMVSHIGYGNDEKGGPCDTTIIANSHYIDIVIGAHSHSVIAPGSDTAHFANADGRLIPIGQNGSDGKLVATYDLDLATGNVVYNQIPVDATWDEAASRYTAMEKWLTHYRWAVSSMMRNTVGTSKREMARGSQALMNWVSDASLEIAKRESGINNIDCAIMNKGGFRTDMPKGKVSEGDIFMMFPFKNHYVVFEMSGAELLDWLTVMANRNGDAVSKDLRVTYNNGIITSAKLKGKDIDPTKTYIVTTNNYIAEGGDKMKAIDCYQYLWVDKVRYGERMIEYVESLTDAKKFIDANDEARMQKTQH